MVNQAPPGTDIAVTTLGEFSVAWGRAVPAAEWSRKRAAALFRALIGAPGFRLSADAVVERLWPESTPLAGRTNLRVKIFEIRAILARYAPPGIDASAAPPLSFEGGVVALEGRYGPRVDAFDFERDALRALDGSSDAAILTALDAYTGPYLPDDRDDASVALRERFARVHRALGLRAASALAAEPERVERLLAPLFAAYPYDEEIALALGTVHAALGRRVDVRDLYYEHERALGSRCGLSPSPRLAALAGFRNGTASKPEGSAPHDGPEASANGSASGPGAVHSPANGVPAPRRLTALVGRAAELRVVAEALDAVARGARRRVDIAGPAGVGKTRMAREIEALARARGFAVGFTRAFREAPLDVLADELLESLSRGAPAPEACADDGELVAIRAALAERLAAGPVVAIVDDAPHAPAALLEALCAATGARARTGFALVTVGRVALPMPACSDFSAEDCVPLELEALPGHDVRAVLAGAFDAPASSELLDALAALWPGDLATALAAAAHARTSGAAVAGADGWELRPGAQPYDVIPERNRLSIVRRILALPPAAIETVKAIAFAGERATAPTLALLTARASESVEAALDAIAAAGLGRRTAAGCELPLAVRSVAGELLSRRRRSLFVERLASGIGRSLV